MIFGARIGGLFKFLIGILLLQGATALLTYTALKTDLQQTAWLFGALAASLGVLVALSFDSVIGSVNEHVMARDSRSAIPASGRSCACRRSGTRPSSCASQRMPRRRDLEDRRRRRAGWSASASPWCWRSS